MARVRELPTSSSPAVAGLIDAGQLWPIVDEVFPLARARDAYAHRSKSCKSVLRIVENG